MQQNKLKVLFVSQNHPTLRAGGSEVYAVELYQAMRQVSNVEAFFLARAGPPYSSASPPHVGTSISTVTPDDSNQYLLHSDCLEYDHLRGANARKDHLTGALDQFLRTIQPDVVHVHQTAFIGYDFLQLVRRISPETVIVHTLHEFRPICHRDGQMLRAGDHERCMEATPRRCHECFPDIQPSEFFLREKFIRAQLENVDLFLAPSRFLRERFLDWGLPPERIRHEPYGRALHLPLSPDPGRLRSGPRWRFGFFGQESHFKGILVILHAIQLLRKQGAPAQLWIHGNNLDLQPPEFRRILNEQLAGMGDSVVHAGPYSRDELPRVMANVDWVVVPSIWWENQPLVIQEAGQFRRPVICGDVGGMAEAVADDVNGLRFKTGDPNALMDVMLRAAQTPGLWEQLSEGAIPPVCASEQATRLAGSYRELLEARCALV